MLKIANNLYCISERWTVKQFTGEDIPKEVMLALLDDAVWAPFHSRNEPWRGAVQLEMQAQKKLKKNSKKLKKPR
ncbi:nitroreductase family protein [Paenibacillus alba]|uniref:Nitroreductase family protein n=1 Tax=Paenibacillus alba TaxID=1197127 RepID=A0ABU6GEP8_9BACL|nr:nitroreductase family protein [Paenibacillus alba]MEC0232135.1 nitroreductase family protein [Paenibacillus alba]